KRAGDVDASSREEFLFGGQVERRESKTAAGTGAADDWSGQNEGTSEQAGGASDVSGGNFPANRGAGYGLAFTGDRRDDHDGESVLPTEFAEQRDGAGLLVTETEI